MKTRLFLFCVAAVQLLSAQNNDLLNSFNKKILDKIFVTAIAFDNQGNAWIGTFNQGLIKYNGKETIHFNSKNSCFGDSAHIEDIKIDGRGNVWIGEIGLVKFDGKKFTRYNSRNSAIPEDWVKSIAIDSKDNVWFSSSRASLGGLVKYDGHNFTVFTPSNSVLPVNMVQSITIDKNDHVWLAMAESVQRPYLVKIEGDKWTVYGSKELGFTPYFLSDIKVNNNNEVYCTIDYGLSSSWSNDRSDVFTFNGSRCEQFNTEKAGFGSRLLAIDNRGRVWRAANTLALLEGSGWQESSQKFEGIFAIEQAKDNKMWIGTGNGIYIQNN